MKSENCIPAVSPQLTSIHSTSARPRQHFVNTPRQVCLASVNTGHGVTRGSGPRLVLSSTKMAAGGHLEFGATETSFYLPSTKTLLYRRIKHKVDRTTRSRNIVGRIQIMMGDQCRKMGGNEQRRYDDKAHRTRRTVRSTMSDIIARLCAYPPQSSKPTTLYQSTVIQWIHHLLS